MLQGEITGTLSAEEAEDDLDGDREASDITRELPSASAHEMSRVDHVIELLKRIRIDSKALTFAEKLGELFEEDSRRQGDRVHRVPRDSGYARRALRGTRVVGALLPWAAESPPEGQRDRSIPSRYRATGPSLDRSRWGGSQFPVRSHSREL